MTPETLTETPPFALGGTWIEVRLDRILENLERLREKAGPDTRVMAVVKSNAYGHGLVPVAKALEGKVDFLGIGSLKEAHQLREQEIRTPLFLFGRIFPEEIPLALKLGLVLTVSSLEEAKAISGTVLGGTGPRPHFDEPVPSRTVPLRTVPPIPACVHVKVDTGMGRLGIPYGRAFSEIVTLASLPGIRLEGIYTHFPMAEKFPDFFGEKQLSYFEKLIQRVEKRGITFAFRHAANSAGTVRFRSEGLNLVRPGIALYGIYPDPSFRNEIELKPVLSLKTRIMFLKRLSPGDSVGYGREFIAASPTTIAVVPAGYAHGYPFHLSGKGEVLYRGRRFRIVGRVCMDSMMVDLGTSTQARVGEEVILLGGTEKEQITAEELATLAQTIPYEIVTRLDPGIPRFYKGDPLAAVRHQPEARNLAPPES